MLLTSLISIVMRNVGSISENLVFQISEISLQILVALPIFWFQSIYGVVRGIGDGRFHINLSLCAKIN